MASKCTCDRVDHMHRAQCPGSINERANAYATRKVGKRKLGVNTLAWRRAKRDYERRYG